MDNEPKTASATRGVPQDDCLKIVILGGGFGGVYAARRLRRRLGRNAQILLIDRQNFMLFTPMLAEAVGRSIAPRHAAVPLSRLLKGVAFRQAEIERIDLTERLVTLRDGEVIAADHLVVALGSVTNVHSVSGAASHGYTMKSLEDACNVQRQAIANVRQAGRLAPGEERNRLLKAVVAGAGYTGVETAAAINELMRFEAKVAGLSQDEVCLTLVETRDHILDELPDTLRKYATKVLREDGITIRTSVAVSQVADSHRLTLSDGTVLEHSLLVWNTGIQPSPQVLTSAGPKGRHRGLMTESTFRVRDFPGVWALGDAAETPKPYDPTHIFEYTAQNAIREGVVLADNIVKTIRGQETRPFRYRQIGTLAVISGHRAVANILGINVKGVLAWLLWRGVYIAKLPSMRNRISVLWDYLRLEFSRRYVPAAKCPEEVPPMS